MKKYTLLFISCLSISTAFAQVVLTYRNNAPLPGDTLATEAIEAFSPGNSGPGQVWDFSTLQPTGEKNISTISSSAKSAKLPDGIYDFNTILNDKGYDYFYKIDENRSEIVGLVNKDLSIAMSDPITKISYPVFYGKSYTDEFSGSGINKYQSSVAISGDYTVEADAYGTIILNDRIIKDVLRIKITENKLQLNPCNIYEIKTTAYAWYAPSARYPLIGLTTREVKNNGQEPEITTLAFMNRDMCQTGIMLTGSGSYEANANEVALIVYPNPFVSKLYYNYFLRKQLPVTIDLVDMNGKTVLNLADAQLQDEGFHTGELDAVKKDLKMGVYYFRFTLGDKVYVSKVVKM
jgi:hypothetical protein